jgi:hypothetical protein
VLERLGDEGAAATVWVARDRHIANHRVAIKLFKRPVFDADAPVDHRRRILREARAAARYIGRAPPSLPPSEFVVSSTRLRFPYALTATPDRSALGTACVKQNSFQRLFAGDRRELGCHVLRLIELTKADAHRRHTQLRGQGMTPADSNTTTRLIVESYCTKARCDDPTCGGDESPYWVQRFPQTGPGRQRTHLLRWSTLMVKGRSVAPPAQVA